MLSSASGLSCGWAAEPHSRDARAGGPAFGAALTPPGSVAGAGPAITPSGTISATAALAATFCALAADILAKTALSRLVEPTGRTPKERS
jgi:hypothetical protein